MSGSDRNSRDGDRLGGDRAGGDQGQEEPDHPLRQLHANPTIARALYHRVKLRRKAARETSAAQQGGTSEGSTAQGGGASLDEKTRTRLEPHVGGDLSGVKVHTGGQSADAAKALGAKAFTDGADIHFNEGQYAPGTKEGDRLLAHEATHVVQSHQGIHRAPDQSQGEHPQGPEVSHPDDPAEKHADAVGDRTADALHGGSGTGRPAVDVAKLSKAAKIWEAIGRSGNVIGPDVAARIQGMVTPEALTTLVLVLTGGALLQAIPVVGEVVDAGLAAWAIYALGEDALRAGKEIFDFVKGAVSANSETELEAAGSHFGRFVAIVGVDAAVGFLLHKASKGISKEVTAPLRRCPKAARPGRAAWPRRELAAPPARRLLRAATACWRMERLSSSPAVLRAQRRTQCPRIKARKAKEVARRNRRAANEMETTARTSRPRSVEKSG